MNFRYTYKWPSVCSTLPKCETVCVPTKTTAVYCPQTVVVPKCEPIRRSNSYVTVCKSEKFESPSMANCFSFIERPNIHKPVVSYTSSTCGYPRLENVCNH